MLPRLGNCPPPGEGSPGRQGQGRRASSTAPAAAASSSSPSPQLSAHTITPMAAPRSRLSTPSFEAEVAARAARQYAKLASLQAQAAESCRRASAQPRAETVAARYRRRLDLDRVRPRTVLGLHSDASHDSRGGPSSEATFHASRSRSGTDKRGTDGDAAAAALAKEEGAQPHGAPLEQALAILCSSESTDKDLSMLSLSVDDFAIFASALAAQTGVESLNLQGAALPRRCEPLLLDAVTRNPTPIQEVILVDSSLIVNAPLVEALYAVCRQNREVERRRAAARVSRLDAQVSAAAQRQVATEFESLRRHVERVRGHVRELERCERYAIAKALAIALGAARARARSAGSEAAWAKALGERVGDEGRARAVVEAQECARRARVLERAAFDALKRVVVAGESRERRVLWRLRCGEWERVAHCVSLRQQRLAAQRAEIASACHRGRLDIVREELEGRLQLHTPHAHRWFDDHRQAYEARLRADEERRRARQRKTDEEELARRDAARREAQVMGDMRLRALHALVQRSNDAHEALCEAEAEAFSALQQLCKLHEKAAGKQRRFADAFRNFLAASRERPKLLVNVSDVVEPTAIFEGASKPVRVEPNVRFVVGMDALWPVRMQLLRQEVTRLLPAARSARREALPHIDGPIQAAMRAYASCGIAEVAWPTNFVDHMRTPCETAEAEATLAVDIGLIQKKKEMIMSGELRISIDAQTSAHCVLVFDPARCEGCRGVDLFRNDGVWAEGITLGRVTAHPQFTDAALHVELARQRAPAHRGSVGSDRPVAEVGGHSHSPSPAVATTPTRRTAVATPPLLSEEILSAARRRFSVLSGHEDDEEASLRYIATSTFAPEAAASRSLTPNPHSISPTAADGDSDGGGGAAGLKGRTPNDMQRSRRGSSVSPTCGQTNVHERGEGGDTRRCGTQMVFDIPINATAEQLQSVLRCVQIFTLPVDGASSARTSDTTDPDPDPRSPPNPAPGSAFEASTSAQRCPVRLLEPFIAPVEVALSLNLVKWKSFAAEARRRSLPGCSRLEKRFTFNVLVAPKVIVLPRKVEHTHDAKTGALPLLRDDMLLLNAAPEVRRSGLKLIPTLVAAVHQRRLSDMDLGTTCSSAASGFRGLRSGSTSSSSATATGAAETAPAEARGSEGEFVVTLGRAARLAASSGSSNGSASDGDGGDGVAAGEVVAPPAARPPPRAAIALPSFYTKGDIEIFSPLQSPLLTNLPTVLTESGEATKTTMARSERCFAGLFVVARLEKCVPSEDILIFRQGGLTGVSAKGGRLEVRGKVCGSYTAPGGIELHIRFAREGVTGSDVRAVFASISYRNVSLDPTFGQRWVSLFAVNSLGVEVETVVAVTAFGVDDPTEWCVHRTELVYRGLVCDRLARAAEPRLSPQSLQLTLADKECEGRANSVAAESAPRSSPSSSPPPHTSTDGLSTATEEVQRGRARFVFHETLTPPILRVGRVIEVVDDDTTFFSGGYLVATLHDEQQQGQEPGVAIPAEGPASSRLSAGAGGDGSHEDEERGADGCAVAAAALADEHAVGIFINIPTVFHPIGMCLLSPTTQDKVTEGEKKNVPGESYALFHDGRPLGAASFGPVLGTCHPPAQRAAAAATAQPRYLGHSHIDAAKLQATHTLTNRIRVDFAEGASATLDGVQELLDSICFASTRRSVAAVRRYRLDVQLLVGATVGQRDIDGNALPPTNFNVPLSASIFVTMLPAHLDLAESSELPHQRGASEITAVAEPLRYVESAGPLFVFDDAGRGIMCGQFQHPLTSEAAQQPEGWNGGYMRVEIVDGRDAHDQLSLIDRWSLQRCNRASSDTRSGGGRRQRASVVSVVAPSEPGEGVVTVLPASTQFRGRAAGSNTSSLAAPSQTASLSAPGVSPRVRGDSMTPRRSPSAHSLVATPTTPTPVSSPLQAPSQVALYAERKPPFVRAAKNRVSRLASKSEAIAVEPVRADHLRAFALPSFARGGGKAASVMESAAGRGGDPAAQARMRRPSAFPEAANGEDRADDAALDGVAPVTALALSFASRSPSVSSDEAEDESAVGPHQHRHRRRPSFLQTQMARVSSTLRARASRSEKWAQRVRKIHLERGESFVDLAHKAAWRLVSDRNAHLSETGLDPTFLSPRVQAFGLGWRVAPARGKNAAATTEDPRGTCSEGDAGGQPLSTTAEEEEGASRSIEELEWERQAGEEAPPFAKAVELHTDAAGGKVNEAGDANAADAQEDGSEEEGSEEDGDRRLIPIGTAFVDEAAAVLTIQFSPRTTTSPAMAAAVMRAISFSNTSRNPAILRKSLRITHYIPHQGTSIIERGVVIEPFDDPTEITLRQPVLRWRCGASGTAPVVKQGFNFKTRKAAQQTQAQAQAPIVCIERPIAFQHEALRELRLFPPQWTDVEDPDTTHWDGGGIHVEQVSGGHPSDRLRVVSVERQVAELRIEGVPDEELQRRIFVEVVLPEEKRATANNNSGDQSDTDDGGGIDDGGGDDDGGELRFVDFHREVVMANVGRIRATRLEMETPCAEAADDNETSFSSATTSARQQHSKLAATARTSRASGSSSHGSRRRRSSGRRNSPAGAHASAASSLRNTPRHSVASESDGAQKSAAIKSHLSWAIDFTPVAPGEWGRRSITLPLMKQVLSAIGFTSDQFVSEPVMKQFAVKVFDADNPKHPGEQLVDVRYLPPLLWLPPYDDAHPPPSTTLVISPGTRPGQRQQQPTLHVPDDSNSNNNNSSSPGSPSGSASPPPPLAVPYPHSLRQALTLPPITYTLRAALEGRVEVPLQLHRIGLGERDRLTPGSFIEVFAVSGFSARDQLAAKFYGTAFVFTADGLVICAKEIVARSAVTQTSLRLDFTRECRGATGRRLQQLLQCFVFSIDVRDTREKELIPLVPRLICAQIGEARYDLFGRPEVQSLIICIDVE